MKKKILFILPALLIGCAQKTHKTTDQYQRAVNLYEEASFEARLNPKKALNIINKSLEFFATPKSLLLKATLLYSIKEYQESVALFKKIINDKNTPPAMRTDAMNNYACALYDMGNQDEAIATWSVLITDQNYLSPELALYNIGISHLKHAMELQSTKSKEFPMVLDKAEDALYCAQKISRYFVDALFYLSQVYIMQGRKAEAKELLERVLAEAPEHALAKMILQKI
jgi:tetratricopeptide (TPR) repeat protein